MAKQSQTVEAFNRIMGELKNKIYKPIYFLTGDEPYFIDKIAEYIEHNVLSDSDKAFNQTVVYGRDTTVNDVINAARRFPMMSNYQVLIVKEAQNIKNLSDLEIYLKAPLESTILVVCHKLSSDGKKSSSKLSGVIKLAKQKGVAFESKKFYDYQIPDWIIGYLSSKGLKIEPVAANLLAEFVGNDLSRLAKELDKLIITLPPETKQVQPVDIERNIGVSRDFNRFELTKALGEANFARAYKIADHFAKNPNANPFVLTITAIYQYFVKILKYHLLPDKNKSSVAKALGVHEFFVSEYERAAKRYPAGRCVSIIHLLSDYDMRSKGVNNSSADHGELLKELIYLIVYGR
ncbi:MAG: polymerase subunit delta [Tenuifilum sp.]|jgi:DNA polymerase-3 subunit delta|uniref:DNA polymerase III subunit delta n=1 Tax=Tenuifilum sp. TaxID=2760880 RepID=UPI0024AC4A20|nr:DNA polymerase III subunit delta [Tenuifilum sp.]MDI3527213.1 polymerase subunit delta [Tenuifilum sp.]